MWQICSQQVVLGIVSKSNLYGSAAQAAKWNKNIFPK
jgi:hypothetical protein